MWDHNTKLDRANVVAGFNSQDDSEEAVLGLRLAGFSDNRIGYYYPTGKGQMTDSLANHHRFMASVVGCVIGVIVGLVFARWGYLAPENPDPVGLILASTVCGALFFGMVGGMMSGWSARLGSRDTVLSEVSEPFVLTVDAGGNRNEAWEIIHMHGGHDLATHKSHQTDHADQPEQMVISH